MTLQLTSEIHCRRVSDHCRSSFCRHVFASSPSVYSGYSVVKIPLRFSAFFALSAVKSFFRFFLRLLAAKNSCQFVLISVQPFPLRSLSFLLYKIRVHPHSSMVDH